MAEGTELSKEKYVEYHEYVIATVVLLTVGVALFLVGFAVGMDGLLVEEQNGWFRVDIVDHRFITGPALSVVGMTLLVFSVRPYVHAQQIKAVGYTYEVVR